MFSFVTNLQKKNTFNIIYSDKQFKNSNVNFTHVAEVNLKKLNIAPKNILESDLGELHCV